MLDTVSKFFDKFQDFIIIIIFDPDYLSNF